MPQYPQIDTEHQPKAEQAEAMKRAIYDKLSPRRRRFVDRVGYDNWDPFIIPKDPIEIRREERGMTVSQLIDAYMASGQGLRQRGPVFAQGVSDAALGMMQQDERIQGIYEFCRWYFEETEQGRAK